MDKLSNSAWLLVEIIKKIDDDTTIVQSEIFDGTKFTIQVPFWSIEPIENKPSHGWLPVEYHGERDGRVSITLPSPIIDKGHRISVDVKIINKLKIKL